MSQSNRFRTQCLLEYETSYKVAPSSTTAVKLPFNSMGLKTNRAIQQPGTIRGSRNPTTPFRGNLDVSGPIVVPVDLVSIGFWLKLLLGTPSTTGSESPYTHVFSVGNTVPSAIIDKGFADNTLYYKYDGVKANTFDITFGGDGELTASVGLIGSSITKGTSAYDASPTDYTSIATRFENFEAAITEGGSSIATLTEVSLSINNNLDGSVYCIGDSGVRSQLPEGQIAVTGSITGLFQDDNLLVKGRNFTESEMVITITDGVYSLAFDIGELVYDQTEPEIQGPGTEGVLQTMGFTGYYQDDSDVSAILITLVNTIATFPAT